MAIETTPKDITPIKRTGIDMTVKAVRKSFPFIMGYKDDESVDTYNSAHYIDLIVDLKKLSEYMDAPVNPFWLNELRHNNRYEKVYAIWSYLMFSDTNSNESNHPGPMLGQKINNKIESLYSFLPEKYVLHYVGEYSSTAYQVRLKVNGYIMR